MRQLIQQKHVMTTESSNYDDELTLAIQKSQSISALQAIVYKEFLKGSEDGGHRGIDKKTLNDKIYDAVIKLIYQEIIFQQQKLKFFSFYK